MPELDTLEKEVYAVRGHFSENRDNLVFLELNRSRIPEINSRLNIVEKNDFIKRIKHPLKGKIETYQLFYLGYFSADDVKSYFCSNCYKEYDEKPSQEIFIRLPDDLFPDHVGEFYLKCNHCNNYILRTGIIRGGEKVDTKLIVRDDRGLFIPKTEKDVNNELEKLLEKAKKEPYFIGGSDLESVEYWAKNLHIDISERLKHIENVREENYFKNYQERLSEIVSGFHKEAWLIGNSHRLLGSDDEMTYEGGTGFYEKWEEFVKYLPKLSFTPELKQKTLEALATIKLNVTNRNKILREMIEEKTKEFNDAINDAVKEEKEYEDLENLVKSK